MALVDKTNIQLINVKSVHNSIQIFLNEKGNSSSNTRIAYEKDIKNFFSIMLGKELSQLTVHDLRFDQENIYSYRSYLQNLKKSDGSTPKYKNASINRFIDSVRSLFKKLRKSGYDAYIDKYAFSIEDLSENDTVGAGEFFEGEFELFEDAALNLHNGLMKSYLIGLAGRTSIRKSALLNLKWSDIKPHDKDIWLVKVIDKGNKEDLKPIMDCFYKKLLELKVEDQNKIFNISSTAVDNMMKQLCKMLSIPEERNITFHSLKGFGVNVVIDNGGSVFDAKDQANHENVDTTIKKYRKRTKDYSNYAGVIIDSELDMSALDELSKEQLLELIKSMNTVTQRSILKKYNNKIK